MKTRPDIYLPNGYLRPGIIAKPGTPSEVLPQVLQYFAPPGARLPHKFRQTFCDNMFFNDWMNGEFYVDEYDNPKIYEFLELLDTWVRDVEQNLPFFYLFAELPQSQGVQILFDFEWYAESYAKGKHQVFETPPARKPHGIWALETDEEIQIWKSRKNLYTIQK